LSSWTTYRKRTAATPGATGHTKGDSRRLRQLEDENAGRVPWWESGGFGGQDSQALAQDEINVP
jgi:hypothetical protein